MSGHKIPSIKPVGFSGACLLLLQYSPGLAAQDIYHQADMQAITANWICEWCPKVDEHPDIAEVSAGVSVVSNDSYAYGNYSGLDQKGAHLITDLDYLHRDPQGNYVQLEGNDLGLDSRHLASRGGKPGRLEMALIYDQLPTLKSDTSRTPYEGGADQRLPGTWVTSATTDGMSELGTALHRNNIDTLRRDYRLSADYAATSDLSYSLELWRDTKTGGKATGVALGTSFATARSVILVAPIDHVTDQGEASLNYRNAQWQGTLKYAFSSFQNQNTALQWDNAYSQPAATERGQAALEPDNNMQQLALSGSYRISKTTLAHALIAYGRAEQDATFLPYTSNTNLNANPLPSTSLHGRINSYDLDLSVTSGIDQLKLKAQYGQHEQANATARATYDYVTADTALNSSARANFPYSFRRRNLALEARYLLPAHHQLALTFEHEANERTYQEVTTTRENTLTTAYANQVSPDLALHFSLGRRQRTGDDYRAVEEVTPAENPLLKKYNLADRTRNLANASASYTPLANLQLALTVDYAQDDYSHSALGLQDSSENNTALDLHYALSRALALNTNYAVTNIASRQSGNQSSAQPNWRMDNDERMTAAGLGVHYDIIADKLNLAFEYGYAAARGDITVSTGTPFPALTNERHTYKVSSDYQLNQQATVQVSYQYEKYKAKNWGDDGSVANTLPNVLTLGEVSPYYDVGLLAIAVRYAF